jgi:UDPglucose 6-dehydrogenase
MKIVIVGYGFVGKAVFNALKAKHNVVIVDPQYTTTELKHHPDADGYVVCVPTPSLENGGCDSSNIANVLDELLYDGARVLIKSTVTPAVTEALDEIYPNMHITYSPEFLRAKTANQDFLNQTHMVLGGVDPEGFWQDVFTPVLEKCKLYFHCSPTEAALVKYATNSFLATKVSFFNELYDLCTNANADFGVVRQIVAADTRIGNSHTLVPGLDGERGFGGACFPKDTAAIMHYANAIGTNLSVIESAVKYNRMVRNSVDI